MTIPFFVYLHNNYCELFSLFLYFYANKQLLLNDIFPLKPNPGVSAINNYSKIHKSSALSSAFCLPEPVLCMSLLNNCAYTQIPWFFVYIPRFSLVTYTYPSVLVCYCPFRLKICVYHLSFVRNLHKTKETLLNDLTTSLKIKVRLSLNTSDLV